MKAFVDSREPKGLKNLAKNKHDFETKELPQGDFYLPEKDVVIERKDASDFASSTTEGRLSQQADRMIAEHEHVYVIIENDLYWRNDEFNSLYNQIFSDIGENSIIGMQTSLAVKRGIKIIYTESGSQTLYAAKRVFERYLDDEHEKSNTGYVKTADTGEVEDVQLAMLMQIRGISEEKAREILDQYYCRDGLAGFGSEIRSEPRTIKNDLQMIDGIGEVLADRVIEAFK